MYPCLTCSENENFCDSCVEGFYLKEKECIECKNTDCSDCKINLIIYNYKIDLNIYLINI